MAFARHPRRRENFARHSGASAEEAANGLLPVLNAYPRINQDLRMADKLKATGAGNLFVVFGEPDIVIHKLKDDMLKVEIRGMDIFDPTTGEVRSSGGKELMNDVAAWFIDQRLRRRKLSSCARPISSATTPMTASSARSRPKSTKPLGRS